MRRQSAVEVAQELLAQAEGAEDPWLISYADLVTNLLAFMVLLVSMAGISFESIDAIPAMFEGSDRPAPLQTLSAEILQLAEQEGLLGQVGASVEAQGLEIMLQDKILFPSGVATLSGEGSMLMQKIARLLNRLPAHYQVAVEGHTDDVPIATARFPSNWELSAARALEVRTWLQSAGVSDRRLSIGAYADTRPVKTTNVNLEEQRRRNRRVVIRVYY